MIAELRDQDLAQVIGGITDEEKKRRMQLDAKEQEELNKLISDMERKVAERLERELRPGN